LGISKVLLVQATRVDDKVFLKQLWIDVKIDDKIWIEKKTEKKSWECRVMAIKSQERPGILIFYVFGWDGTILKALSKSVDTKNFTFNFMKDKKEHSVFNNLLPMHEDYTQLASNKRVRVWQRYFKAA
jgi:hypothetical protein